MSLSWPRTGAPASERQALLSMTRRVTLTVLTGFTVVFVVLFAWLWQEGLAQDTGYLDRAMVGTAKAMAASLDAMDSDEGAMALELMFRHTQGLADAANGPPLHLAIARHDGRITRVQPELEGLDLRAAPPGAGDLVIGGRRWRLYTAAGTRWKAAVAHDATARLQWVGWDLLTDLLKYLPVAFVLVLLPVWLMARASLQPLRQLSATVAARSPLDTRPLPARSQWQELAPLETALNRLFERMAHSLAREKAFVHDAAHELRTPLALIATQAHVLTMSQGPARVEAAERLAAAVERSSHLAQQLLQLARADAVAELTREPLDLMDLARDAMSLLADRAAAQSTELELQGPEQLPLLSDARALRSILDNLLDNALGHGGAGGCVTVAVAATHGLLLLSVSDQGPGIGVTARDQVFERFWRGAALAYAGSGLGLAIVREAARGLGGDAEVVDAGNHTGTEGPVQPARGATVQVWLPVP